MDPPAAGYRGSASSTTSTVQVPFMAEADAATKSGVVLKPSRALWWFLMGRDDHAHPGLAIIGAHHDCRRRGHEPRGASVSPWRAAGHRHFLNVWLVIWPNQKSSSKPAGVSGGPKAAGGGARVSRVHTNTLFSIPMLSSWPTTASPSWR
jgi:hypothetical protein